MFFTKERSSIDIEVVVSTISFSIGESVIEGTETLDIDLYRVISNRNVHTSEVERAWDSVPASFEMILIRFKEVRFWKRSDLFTA